ncbi:DUF1456 family protein [Fundicoccus sp. Sow4_D5]|uniref:DUF1456 family protein n=1 Tax=Fundicoccus sp. Sow4_D5 TaxID=3438782 RepID=UPI003F93911E
MNHNDRLTRLRYGLDIKDEDMVEIFAMGGVTLSKEEVQALLKKQLTETTEAADERAENVYEMTCTDEQFERFLNGLIISQRGAKDDNEPALELNSGNANNLMLKKIKIALKLTSDDILDILEEAGVVISNSELSAVLRREGHRNYKPCGDRYIRNFLKGLALRYR